MNVLTLTEQPGSREDAITTAGLVKKTESTWIVVDGYRFGSEYQKLLKDNHCRILFIDDYGHADHYYADLVLNQNIYADLVFYKNYEPYTQFLLGSDFVLLRREFLNRAGEARNIPDIARKILVTFGGSDPDNITLKILEALKTIDLNGLEVIAVIGGVSESYETLLRRVKTYPGFSIRKNVTDMPGLMMWADVAISAAGSTCWELAFTGLPAIILPVSHDQELIASYLTKNGVSVTIGNTDGNSDRSLINALAELIYSPDKRSVLSENGKRVVDGNGPRRIISALCSH
jgi:UDP-2,4-diacetamido-2,4,6-trideoxy-beta-L-altropyranose hydrolase